MKATKLIKLLQRQVDSTFPCNDMPRFRIGETVYIKHNAEDVKGKFKDDNRWREGLIAGLCEAVKEKRGVSGEIIEIHYLPLKTKKKISNYMYRVEFPDGMKPLLQDEWLETKNEKNRYLEKEIQKLKREWDKKQKDIKDLETQSTNLLTEIGKLKDKLS